MNKRYILVMGCTYKKVAKPYKKATIMQACQGIDEKASLRGTAAKYNIGYGRMQRTYFKIWILKLKTTG
jgi:hypothetical protein